MKIFSILTYNILITLCYFGLFLYKSWNVSGGDIFLLFATGVSISIHAIILIIIYSKRESLFFKSLIGLIIGALLCGIIYFTIENSKSKKMPRVEIDFH